MNQGKTIFRQIFENYLIDRVVERVRTKKFYELDKNFASPKNHTSLNYIKGESLLSLFYDISIAVEVLKNNRVFDLI